MSLDVRLQYENEDGADVPAVFDANITHNLTKMADAAGLYDVVWRPEENGVTQARQLVEPLRAGIALMKAAPERFKAMDSPNGWGLYENFLPWLERYLEACERYPSSKVSVSR